MIISTGTLKAADLAVDSADNLYLTDATQNLLVKIPVQGNSYGNPILLAYGLLKPAGVALGTDGSVIVADTGHHSVLKLPVASGVYGSLQTLTTNFASPSRVAVDRLLNVYVADAASGQVARIPLTPRGYEAPVALGSGFSGPAGLAVDSGLDVLVADANAVLVGEIIAGTLPATPAVTWVWQASGPIAGGNTVTFSGLHLANTLSVAFNGVPATIITANTDTSMTVIAPPAPGGQAQTVNIVVTTVGGTSTRVVADHYTYK